MQASAAKPACLVLVFLLLFRAVGASGADDAVHIYVDADRTGTLASGLAIEQGIRTALSEVGDRLDGRPVEIIIRDHRGSSPRSKSHLQEYLADQRALVVFSGQHSPPLLAHREFINQRGILVLDPWAAAGPITRYPSAENWIFRLSIDDTKAGYVIARHAIRKEGFSRPFLLLEETGWGKSNQKTMTRALAELGLKPAGLVWFNWNLGLSGAKITLREIAASGADVIFLVANAPEGKTFARAMAALPPEQRLPFRSHWGITGGDFPKVIDKDLRSQVDLLFLQTRFSFISNPDDAFGHEVLQTARRVLSIDSAYDIAAPDGFIHAYDLTRLLVAAVTQVGLSDDIPEDRKRVRTALENIERPVQGLVKTYIRPFGVFSAARTDAHEALGIGDFVMAYYGDQGEIILVGE